MDDEMRQILQQAEAAEGFYDGTLEALPWTFWLRELHDPEKDVTRMMRIWAGEYLEVRRFGEDPHDEYIYTFRDEKGVGEMLISENMAFQYFRWFFDAEHMRREMESRSPDEVSRGLPSESHIVEAIPSADQLTEFLSVARAVAIAYVAGQDYSDEVLGLVLEFERMAPNEW